MEPSDGFWRLVDAGYLSVRRAGPDLYDLVGHKYVGRALVDGLEIRIDEKIPGTLASLAAVATGSELRIAVEGAPATDFDLFSRHLMRQFTSAAARYLAARQKPRYEYQSKQGPVMSGALDLPRTMRLHATGRLGHFAFNQGYVVRDEPLDRLVLAALESLDRAAEALRLDADTVYEARWLSGSLAEIRDQRFLSTTGEAFLAIADAVERASDQRPEDVDLARLAVVALLHRGCEPDRDAVGQVPRAWFVDLETLFEAAVRSSLRRLLGKAAVDRGEGFPRRIFTGGSDASRAYPDLVVHWGDVVLAVGDVKYKALAAGLGHEDESGEQVPGVTRIKEGRPDLYQVLVHGASLEASKAFLVYAGDSYECVFPGIAATGAAMWTAQVRPSQLDADLAAVAKALALTM